MTPFSKSLSCAAEAAVTERVLRQRVVLFTSWYSHTVVSLGADDLFIPLPRCDVKWLFWKIGQILKRDISLIKDKSSKIRKVWSHAVEKIRHVQYKQLCSLSEDVQSWQPQRKNNMAAHNNGKKSDVTSANPVYSPDRSLLFRTCTTLIPKTMF